MSAEQVRFGAKKVQIGTARPAWSAEQVQHWTCSSDMVCRAGPILYLLVRHGLPSRSDFRPARPAWSAEQVQIGTAFPSMVSRNRAKVTEISEKSRLWDVMVSPFFGHGRPSGQPKQDQSDRNIEKIETFGCNGESLSGHGRPSGSNHILTTF